MGPVMVWVHIDFSNEALLSLAARKPQVLIHLTDATCGGDWPRKRRDNTLLYCFCETMAR